MRRRFFAVTRSVNHDGHLWSDAIRVVIETCYAISEQAMSTSDELKYIFDTDIRRVGIDLDQFAQFLGGFVVDRPVINRTGLTRVFEAHLRFASEGTALSPLPAFVNAGPAATEPAASIFTAMQGQLGLQLESAKGPG